MRICWKPSPQIFLSTPSARRATPSELPEVGTQPISIHALREEGDAFGENNPQGIQISIHALREEGDYECFKRRIKPNVFLSTPSARRATPFIVQITASSLFLSTPSARRATRRSCA